VLYQAQPVLVPLDRDSGVELAGTEPFKLGRHFEQGDTLAAGRVEFQARRVGFL
jgi:hypothetical protein